MIDNMNSLTDIYRRHKDRIGDNASHSPGAWVRSRGLPALRDLAERHGAEPGTLWTGHGRETWAHPEICEAYKRYLASLPTQTSEPDIGRIAETIDAIIRMVRSFTPGQLLRLGRSLRPEQVETIEKLLA